jgi:drug/metabolite transporter (DMT)-like permease
MTRLSPSLLGILVMLIGMFLFAANDALGKWLVGTYSVGEVLLIRSLAALIILLPFLFTFGWRQLLHLDRPWLQFLRVCLASAEVFCFYFAVRSLPLADTMTYWMAAPIYVALLSAIILRERVGILRWCAIIIGFGGAVIALAPTGDGWSIASLTAVLGSLCFALMVVTGRTLRGTPDISLVFWQVLGAGVVGFVALPTGWVMPGSIDLALMAFLGVIAMGAHVCVTRALKLADASLIAPLQYTLLLWAIILGWMFFNDIPSMRLLFGAAVIVMAGIILAFSQRLTSRIQADK